MTFKLLCYNLRKRGKDPIMDQAKTGDSHLFGWCEIKDDGQLQLPSAALSAYGLTEAPAVIFYLGSSQTGGLCITSRILLENSPLNEIVTDLPDLVNYSMPAGETLNYKGRAYGWLSLNGSGALSLPAPLLEKLSLAAGSKLLAIRGSNMAFTLGAKGPLLAVAEALAEKVEL